MGVIVELQHKMNYKILSLAIIALFVSLSFASALSFSPGSSTLSLTQGSNQTINLVNDNSFAFTSIALSTPSVSGATISVSPSSLGALAQNAVASFNLAVASVTGSFDVGDKVTATLNATGTNASGQLTVVSLPITLQKSFCRSGAAGTNLSITSIDIKSSGDDDTTWQLLDTVRVKVRFENQGENTIRGVNVELGLFDENGVNKASDLEYSSSDEDKVSYGSLKDGDDDTVIFEFRVPVDIKAENYRLAVKVYSTSAGQDNVCADSSSDLESTIYQNVDVETESSKGKLIAFDDTQFSPSEAVCGESVTLSATAFNIGDDDQDRVKVTVFNDELRVSQTQELTSGIDQGESTPVDFNFVIPSSAAAKTYLLNLYADYDYKDGIYRQRSTNYATYQYKVVGCTVTPVVNTTVTPVVNVSSANTQTSSTSASVFGGSNTIWIIAGVNILLLIIIIVVAVRLANR